jgi:redox-sensing transcriptional repressor
MKTPKISESVVRRLPIYLRYLNELSLKNVQTVSSQELGARLDLNPAQIRKDLAYFGEFGKKGIGYDVSYLIEKIRQILKIDQQINVALVGAGNLGRALCNYNMYQKDNMKIRAVFDNSPGKIGQAINHLTVEPLSKRDHHRARIGSAECCGAAGESRHRGDPELRSGDHQGAGAHSRALCRLYKRSVESGLLSGIETKGDEADENIDQGRSYPDDG